jgi:hypothetical protein
MGGENEGGSARRVIPQQEGEATTNNELKYETKKMKEEDKRLHRHVGGCSMAKEGDC